MNRQRSGASQSRWGVQRGTRNALRLTGSGARRLFVGLGAVILLSGCGGRGYSLARPAPETLPANSPLRISSLPDSDAWLRHHMMFGETGPALKRLDQGKGEGADRLLRALQQALVLRYAGDYVRSNELLEWADQEAERRYTRSITRTAGSMVVSDRVLPYTPGPGEMAMIPFYRMMNYYSLGDLEAATVEARRMSALLATGDRGSSRRCSGDATLQYLAGLTFESAGEMNDALVSLRQAEASSSSCPPGARTMLPVQFGADLHRVAAHLGIDEVADSAASRYASAVQDVKSGSGDVLVLLERDFVAHRSQEVLHVPVLEEELEGLESGDFEGIAAAAARITARLVNNLGERAYWGSAWDDEPVVRLAHLLDGAHILRLAWPSLHDEPRSPEPLRIRVDDIVSDVTTAADLSAVVRSQMEEDRAAVFTRMVTRGLARYLISREMEKKAEREGGEVLGFVTGRVANLAANALERADTRAWTLLPDNLSIARLSLPEGIHHLKIETIGSSGESTRVADLGMVEVTSGKRVVVNHRMWSGGEPGAGAAAETPAESVLREGEDPETLGVGEPQP
jgi:uncharacterized protein